MPAGIIIIDKPRDWTSMDVCARLRGVFHEKRIGHAGTLDPMATGVLPVFVGRATRAVQFAESGEKEYMAALRLGTVTNTQDIWGEVLEDRPAQVSREELEAVLPRFRGEIDQVPPMYSAIKVNGKKLYELARKGIEIERKPRRVAIHALELLDPDTPGGDWRLKVRCSKGTYIRSLCHDIGETLGCGGCMSSLVRTEACGFPLEKAHSLEKVIAHSDPESLLLQVDTLFNDRPAYTATAKQEERLRHGGGFSLDKPQGEYRVYSQSGEFLLLGQIADGKLSIIKSFYVSP